jgi:hypothetical protein
MTRYRLAIVLAVGCCATAPAAVAREAKWQKDLHDALISMYSVDEATVKKVFASIGNELKTSSSVLRVRIDGLRVEPEANGGYIQTTIEDGKVTKSGRGVRGLLAGCPNPARRSLKIGERVQIFKIEIDDDLVRFAVATVDEEQVMLRGNTLNTRFFGAILLPFGEKAMPTVTPEQVAAALKPVLGSDEEMAASQTKTVSLEQTPDQVKQALGAPDKVVDLRTKVTWVYKDLKVVFVDGKVSDVQ